MVSERPPRASPGAGEDGTAAHGAFAHHLGPQTVAQGALRLLSAARKPAAELSCARLLWQATGKRLRRELLALVRHFDVLEELLASLDDSKRLRMAELGVACGPIGLFLLQRFPKLQYFGADPTIRDEVREAYRHLGGIESQRMTI